MKKVTTLMVPEDEAELVSSGRREDGLIWFSRRPEVGGDR
jgi:hypothetical protein